MCLCTEKLQGCYMAARLLSVSRRVGAHLRHEGPAGGLLWDSNPQPLKTFVSRGAGSTTEPFPTDKPTSYITRPSENSSYSFRKISPKS